jgi:threonine dehydratase
MTDPTTKPPVSLESIRGAAERIRQYAVHTPLLHQLKLGKAQGADLFLKAENLQRVGAFKFRGAFNTLSRLRAEESPAHVITSSSGNHGQAVAAAGQILGIRVTVVMPENAVQVKVDAVRGYGGIVEFAGTTSPEREARAQDIGRASGGTVIGSFDDARIIDGQGTIGLEIIESLPGVDVILVPVGGGGMISGIATAAKALKPDVRIIGVEPEGASDAYQSLRSGTRVRIDRIDTIADGLRTSSPGVLNFEIMRRLVDEIVLVSDDGIRDAMRALAFDAKLTVEPSGAVAVAGLQSGQVAVEGKTVVAVISGGNADPQAYAAIIGASVDS